MVLQPRPIRHVWLVVGAVVTVVIAVLGSALSSGSFRVVIAVLTVGAGAALGRLAMGRADPRPSVADERDDDAQGRDDAAGYRDLVAGTRDEAAGHRDRSAQRRDLESDRRDAEAGERDQAGNRRDAAGDQRDLAAGERDVASERRDEVRAHHQIQGHAPIETAVDASVGARQEAASDRERASQDRHAGAAERAQAEHDRATASADRGASADERAQADADRNTASADRGASADERGHAEHDRMAALDDRDASAREREYASVDGLTGVYLRSAGFVELDHEVDRARRSGAPLVLAFVDVDHLKDINDSRGHDAGDKTLLAVAKTLAAQMRSYDLIFRYGGDEFVCALVGVTIEDVTKRLALANVALALGPEHASVTAGLADLRPGESADALVARADATLLRLRQQIRQPPEVTNP